MPKSSAPSESRLAGMPFSFRHDAANSSENGIVSATMIAPRNVSQKDQQNNDDQNDALGQVVQHRMRGMVHQFATVDKGNDLHPRRQNVIVHFVNLGVQPAQRRFRIRALCASAPIPETTSSLSISLPSSR
jgi:hypothetical protein